MPKVENGKLLILKFTHKLIVIRVEGAMLISMYALLVISAWFYPNDA